MPLDIDISVFKEIKNNIDEVYKETLIKIGDYIINEAKQSFKRRSFKGRAWKSTAIKSRSRGGIVNKLRKRRLNNHTVEVFVKDLKYSYIQNWGGKIKVTPKMRAFFWAMYYEVSDNGFWSSDEATFWKNAALTKKKYFEIPARRYLDITKEVEQFAADTFYFEFLKEVNKYR